MEGRQPLDSLVSVHKVTNVDESLGVALDQVVHSHGTVGGEAKIRKDADAVLREAWTDCLQGLEVEGWALAAGAITNLRTTSYQSPAKAPAMCMPGS